MLNFTTQRRGRRANPARPRRPGMALDGEINVRVRIALPAFALEHPARLAATAGVAAARHHVGEATVRILRVLLEVTDAVEPPLRDGRPASFREPPRSNEASVTGVLLQATPMRSYGIDLTALLPRAEHPFAGAGHPRPLPPVMLPGGCTVRDSLRGPKSNGYCWQPELIYLFKQAPCRQRELWPPDCGSSGSSIALYPAPRQSSCRRCDKRPLARDLFRNVWAWAFVFF